MKINSAKELEVYFVKFCILFHRVNKKAYSLAMEIFEISKSFPAEEKYALASQFRRLSRPVCLNLREAWAKRRYEAHFINKLTDCDGENSETDSSLDFALDCSYIDANRHSELTSENRKIGKMPGSMLNNPSSFLLNKSIP